VRESDPRTRMTAFRIPTKLLAEVDGFCKQTDSTRSQIFRNAVIELIERHRA
jgi:metal-responsive CopG/Arc/MetJ family transcriptional regulator